ncbi:uncharacterized protein LOC110448678 isoform X2 [Mizuhopecten yessoensis]|nr:uncharacterized protein LOC110448678 isoform X2 [Mizuhopecten yessoensis]
MYEHLIRMDNWWDQLLAALRSNCQHHLADKLEEIDDEWSVPRTDRKVRPIHATRKLQSVRSRICTGDTKYKDLPARVSSVLKIMDSQDVVNNWEAMAAHFKYTNDEVTRMKCNQNQPSCTKKLLEDWSQREDATLKNLLMTLQELERFDLLEQVQSITGYCLPEIRKGQLDCDEHGRDILLPTEMMFSEANKETSMKINENAMPSQGEHDSLVSSCQFNPMTRHSQTHGDMSLSPSDDQVGQQNERNLSPLCDTDIQPSVSFVGKDTSAVDDSKTPDEDIATQGISMNRRPSEEGLDPIHTPGTSNVCGHNNNNNNKINNNSNTDEYDASHGSNVNTSSYPKTMKDKIIDQLPLVGISALGMGLIMALAKIK